MVLLLPTPLGHTELQQPILEWWKTGNHDSAEVGCSDVTHGGTRRKKMSSGATMFIKGRTFLL